MAACEPTANAIQKYVVAEVDRAIDKEIHEDGTKPSNEAQCRCRYNRTIARKHFNFLATDITASSTVLSTLQFRIIKLGDKDVLINIFDGYQEFMPTLPRLLLHN